MPDFETERVPEVRPWSDFAEDPDGILDNTDEQVEWGDVNAPALTREDEDDYQDEGITDHAAPAADTARAVGAVGVTTGDMDAPFLNMTESDVPTPTARENGRDPAAAGERVVVEGEVLDKRTAGPQGARPPADQAEDGAATQRKPSPHPLREAQPAQQRVEVPPRPAEVVGLRHPYDYPLVGEYKVGIAGYSQDVEIVTHQTVVTATRVMEAEGLAGTGVVLAANFGIAQSELSRLGGRGDYNLIDLPVMGAQGVLRALPVDKMAEILADAAASGDDRTAYAYEEILVGVGQALAKPVIDPTSGEQARDPVTGEGRTSTPDLDKINDAIKYFVGARLGALEGVKNEIPSLTAADRTALDRVFQTDRREALAPLFVPLNQWLAKNIQGQATGTDANEARNGRIGVVNMTVSGHGRTLRAQTEALGHSITQMTATMSTPWGRPEMVIIRNADLANQDVMRELLQHCEDLHIPTLVSVSKLTDETAPLIEGGALAFAALTVGEAETASRLMGDVERDDVTGESHAEHRNTGNSTHAGVSLGYEKGSPDPKTGGTSGSRDISEGSTWDRSQTRTIGAGRRVLPHHVQIIKIDELLVAGSDREIMGVYDVRTRERQRRVFPPQGQKKLDVSDKVNPPLEGGGQRALPADAKGAPTGQPQITGSGNPETGEQREAIKAMSKITVGTPYQERQKLSGEFSALYPGSSAMSMMRGKTNQDFVNVAYRRYLYQRDHGQTKRDWASWAESRGISDSVRRARKEDDGSFWLSPREEARERRRR